jgi:hypothetical protein
MKFKLPKLPHFPRLNFTPVKKLAAFLIRHKISIAICISVIVFIVVAMWYRGYLLSKMNAGSGSSSDEIFNSTKSDNSLPTLAIPSPTSDNSIDNSGADNTNNDIVITPFPTFAPLPTIAPYIAPATTTTSSNNNSGNPNCTTGSGAANSWYSDVYPNPPVTTSNGSVTMTVTIRDCNSNTASVSDNLSISLSSGDSNTHINGNNLPTTVTTQNGVASFTVTSQTSGTVTLVVQDTSSNFTVTNINNQNPSIAFSGSSSSGNSSCSTANGVVNSWYSDVYPTSPISAATGSTVTFTVDIRDCGKNNISSDSLTISQTSSDSNLTINGSPGPVTVQAQNGVATFNIISQNAGTDTFTIQDTTSNFTVTDTNNSAPSIIFTGSSTVTPTPTPTPTVTPTPSITPTPSPT